MPASFSVNSALGSYSVLVRRGGFANMLAELDGSAVISDEFFRPQFETHGISGTFVEAVESNKSLEACPEFIQRMRSEGVNRETRLVAVGGGIVQDVSAFIASVYMRGLKWIYVPTTVLAMVDSCIGGKSSINVGPYKNLVGTFHPPEQITVDPELALSLPEIQRASGLIEAAKICFCKGPESFADYLRFDPSPTIGADALEKVIIASLTAKKWFIEVDEFDKKERLLLNFGHTFGHAIEGATHFAVPHGFGVGLGIMCALEFERLNGVSYAAAPHVERLSEHLDAMIRSDKAIGEKLRGMSLEDVLDRLRSDKKHGRDFYALILVDPDGSVQLRRLPKDQTTIAKVRIALERVIERYG